MIISSSNPLLEHAGTVQINAVMCGDDVVPWIFREMVFSCVAVAWLCPVFRPKNQFCRGGIEPFEIILKCFRMGRVTLLFTTFEMYHASLSPTTSQLSLRDFINDQILSCVPIVSEITDIKVECILSEAFPIF